MMRSVNVHRRMARLLQLSEYFRRVCSRTSVSMAMRGRGNLASLVPPQLRRWPYDLYYARPNPDGPVVLVSRFYVTAELIVSFVLATTAAVVYWHIIHPRKAECSNGSQQTTPKAPNPPRIRVPPTPPQMQVSLEEIISEHEDKRSGLPRTARESRLSLWKRKAWITYAPLEEVESGVHWAARYLEKKESAREALEVFCAQSKLHFIYVHRCIRDMPAFFFLTSDAFKDADRMILNPMFDEVIEYHLDELRDGCVASFRPITKGARKLTNNTHS